MNKLPAEIELKILWYLSPLDLCRLGQVNSHWYKVTQNDEIWSYFCQRRFAYSNLTHGEFKKLRKIYPDYIRGWKDWYAFRSMFKREVAGKLSFEITGYFDGHKRTSGKSIYGDFECYSQPPQYFNRLPCTFHFDEYHTYICADLYESKVFRNKIPLGRIAFPLFCIKNQEYTMWIDIEDEEEVLIPKSKKDNNIVDIPNSSVGKKRSRQDSGSMGTNYKKHLDKKDIYIDEDIIDLSNKPIRRQVLVHFSLTPVVYTVQDFEMIASLSRGIYDRRQIESLFVREKDSNNCYFMKILPSDDDESIFLKRDISYSNKPTWSLPPHPFLVDTATIFEVNQKIFVVMEWISGGELFSELRRTEFGRFDEETARFYGSQILLCIRHFHNNKFIYKDLKPENILLTNDGYCKITPRLPDRYNENSITSLMEHMAPEVLLGYNATKKSDWWTFGTIMYHMLVGQPPFTHHNVQTMFHRILEEYLYLPPYLSDSARSLLKGVLNRDMKKRYGFKQIRNSDFFNNVDWQKLIKKELDPPLRPYRNKSIKFPYSKPSHGKVRESPPPSKRKLL